MENVKLKLTNEELSHELAHTCQELMLAQEQLGVLQGQASRLQQEKEMSVYACAYSWVRLCDHETNTQIFFSFAGRCTELQKDCREKKKV